MKIAFASYGHTRVPAQAHVARNSVHLTFYGSFLGVKRAASAIGAEVVDYSPLVGTSGVDWEACGRWPQELEPCDVLYCQAGISRQIIKRARELNPKCAVVLQRDSTHARTHHRLMKEGQRRHQLEWHHFYDDAWNIEADEEEYAMADKIFVLSRWVKSTFEEHGLGHKTVQYASQTVDLASWMPPELPKKAEMPFVAVFVGQMGIRKGTFDLLDAWMRFSARHGSVELYCCGMPEHGAPEAVRRRLELMFSRTPYVRNCGYQSQYAMRSLYERAHVLIAPSVEDGGTMVGPEAALSGCAIIATENAGIDILDHGVTGWQVEHSNITAIEQALEQAVLYRERTTAMGAIARDRAAQCGLEAYVDGCSRAFSTVLEGLR